MKMSKHGVIICGFPGVGKTEAVRRLGGERVHDSDSSKYEKFEGWEKGYCIDLINMATCGKYDYVFCSTHPKVLESLNELFNDIPMLADDRFYIAIPAKDVKCEDWMKRFYTRDNSHIKNLQDFYTFLTSNWDMLINQDMMKYNKALQLYLDSDQYLYNYLY